MSKIFQLGENSQIFWDPTQKDPDNQKLLIGQKKELEETEEVKKALQFGYIRLVSKGELESENANSVETELANTSSEESTLETTNKKNK